jgi:hypothetical protein
VFVGFGIALVAVSLALAFWAARLERAQAQLAEASA